MISLNIQIKIYVCIFLLWFVLPESCVDIVVYYGSTNYIWYMVLPIGLIFLYIR